MTQQEAIKLAIENGWRWKYYDGYSQFEYTSETENGLILTWKHNDSSFEIDKTDAVLDREFWQALGKTLGWIIPDEMAFWTYEEFAELENSWLWHWLNFIKALAEGKEREFWENLK